MNLRIDSAGFSMGEPDSRIRIMQVNTSDDYGGAAKVAQSLHRSYQSRGYPSWLVVGNKHTDQAGAQGEQKRAADRFGRHDSGNAARVLP